MLLIHLIPVITLLLGLQLFAFLLIGFVQVFDELRLATVAISRLIFAWRL